ncbi:dynamin family protein [Scytonema millei]|uniref:Dynamin family protein n=1 Tax=Scytonema millei VB511283 TaxID=1245923 RepID=A0A9X5I4M9_9CYAN|nr:dynamin family protein [Scytonema millei]NHC35130.1 dynamin family protein [Scytonema millei VB511283]
MIVQAPQPNVQNLQQEAIALFKEIGFLMDNAASALSTDSSSDKYKDFQQEVLSVSHNVEKLELMMAIVAPMKAGKSTIINAIAGQEILPSRNAAMTTLPTQIIFNPDLTQPTLTLSPEIISVYQQTLQALQTKIQALGMQRIQDKIAQYPHLQDLLPKIQDPTSLQLQEITSGREEIIQVLMSLNDIVRLCNTIDPSTDPLGRLTEVPCIQVPLGRSRNLSSEDTANNKPDLIGNLVIVDTPGPNEAGENLKLATVVAEQLKQSSMVLIVLDFTQLKTEAAEQVKRDVQRVIDLRGKDNLYILVNKVDQRREGDMTSEQLRQFIAAEFGIGDDDTNQVFEVSARRAFSAAHFTHELEQHPDLTLSEIPAARVLAQEVFGIDWEEELAEVTSEEIRKKAQKLWNKSGFEPFLEKAVKALMERAAPKCLKSALNLGRSRLVQLRDEVKLRSSAICQDAEKLQLELYALEADLHRLELCRSRLKDVDSIKSQLHQNLHELLQVLKKEATVNLEIFFAKEEYQRADLIKKMDMRARELFLTNIGDFELFPKWVSSRLKSQVEFKTSGLFEFESPEVAEEFVDQAVTYVKQRADSLLSSVRARTSQEIEQARQSLLELLEQETKPIIEGACQRLNEAFNLDLSLPTMQWESFETMGFVRPPVKRQSRFVDRGNVEVLRNQRQWWHWLWIVPVEVKVQIRRPRVIEDYYTVSLNTLIAKVNQSIEGSIDNINLEIEKYLDKDFQQRVDVFFANLDTFLHNYRDNLSQAQADQKLSLEEKEKLVEELSFLLPEATAQIQTAETYIEYTDQMLSD